MSVFDNAGGLENGIAQVKDEKSQHEGDCIAAMDENIGDHDACIEKKFDDDG